MVDLKILFYGTLKSVPGEAFISVLKVEAYANADVLFGSSSAADIPKDSGSSHLQWVTKWVDYSNKYGFGYQLSDNTVGVLFNNGTHMSILPDRKWVPFCSFNTFMAASAL